MAGQDIAPMVLNWTTSNFNEGRRRARSNAVAGWSEDSRVHGGDSALAGPEIDDLRESLPACACRLHGTHQ